MFGNIYSVFLLITATFAVHGGWCSGLFTHSDGCDGNCQRANMRFCINHAPQGCDSVRHAWEVLHGHGVSNFQCWAIDGDVYQADVDVGNPELAQRGPEGTLNYIATYAFGDTDGCAYPELTYPTDC